MDTEFNNITLTYKTDDNMWSNIGNTYSGIYVKSQDITDDKTSDILDYYKKAKIAKINEKYDALIKEEYDKVAVVNEYNNIVKDFEENLRKLADKYNTKKEELVVETGYDTYYAYELNENIECDIRKKYTSELEKEIKEVKDLVEEVEAVLSLSTDKDYQVEVLKNYDILDKKGRLNI